MFKADGVITQNYCFTNSSVSNIHYSS